MKIVYSNNEFKPGTLLRRIYYYDDNGDVIMTDTIVYEEIPDPEEDSESESDSDSEDEC